MVTIAIMKHHDQKQIEKEKVYLASASIDHHWRAGIQ